MVEFVTADDLADHRLIPMAAAKQRRQLAKRLR
jgi:hypothetical protein